MMRVLSILAAMLITVTAHAGFWWTAGWPLSNEDGSPTNELLNNWSYIQTNTLVAQSLYEGTYERLLLNPISLHSTFTNRQNYIIITNDSYQVVTNSGSVYTNHNIGYASSNMLISVTQFQYTVGSYTGTVTPAWYGQGDRPGAIAPANASLGGFLSFGLIQLFRHGQTWVSTNSTGSITGYDSWWSTNADWPFIQAVKTVDYGAGFKVAFTEPTFSITNSYWTGEGDGPLLMAQLSYTGAWVYTDLSEILDDQAFPYQYQRGELPQARILTTDTNAKACDLYVQGLSGWFRYYPGPPSGNRTEWEHRDTTPTNVVVSLSSTGWTSVNTCIGDVVSMSVSNATGFSTGDVIQVGWTNITACIPRFTYDTSSDDYSWEWPYKPVLKHFDERQKALAPLVLMSIGSVTWANPTNYSWDGTSLVSWADAKTQAEANMVESAGSGVPRGIMNGYYDAGVTQWVCRASQTVGNTVAWNSVRANTNAVDIAWYLTVTTVAAGVTFDAGDLGYTQNAYVTNWQGLYQVNVTGYSITGTVQVGGNVFPADCGDPASGNTASGWSVGQQKGIADYRASLKWAK